MLCPEIANFPPPKVVTSRQTKADPDSTRKVISMNSFYRSIVITCPDELLVPNDIQEALTIDTEYYKISKCPLSTFLENSFIEKFVKNGKLYCLSADRDAIVQNCAAVTPEGELIIHILEPTYQTLGLEGKKQPNNYYEIKINLLDEKLAKMKLCLDRLEAFDFYISWIPHDENICPSSLAKYFFERDLNVSILASEVTKISPTVEQIPTLIDIELDELAEWVGMLAIGGDLLPKYDYVSTYSEPESEAPIKSNRIALIIVKGFFMPCLIDQVYEKLIEYVNSRELQGYWSSLSLQSYENSPWRWTYSSPNVFRSHESSTTIFIGQNSNAIFSVGQIKLS